mgnify:FL=1
MIFRKTPAVSFSVPDIKQGFSFRAVFLRRQVHYKLLRRSEKSHNGDEGVIRYRKMRADRIRCREKRKPRCFVQPRVKRGKPFVSAERGDIGRGADGKDSSYRPPQPCGKQSYQVRQQLQQHDCIEKQIGNTVELCAEFAFQLQLSCDSAVNRIGQSAEGINNIEPKSEAKRS